MYWRTGEHHNLKHSPFTALVAPRPIGWISTFDREGRANVAPYSFFNAVSYVPPQLIFSVGARPESAAPPVKDTLTNVQTGGCFVANLATWDLRDAMNATSADCPPDVDEFELAGITAETAELVDAPRVKESPVHFECELVQLIETKSPDGFTPNMLVLGEVVGIHISDAVIDDGIINYQKTQPIARLGYLADYAATTDVFHMPRPGWP